mgnify:CR=1 FL=1
MSSFGYDLLGFGSSANTAVATPSDDEFNRTRFLSHFDGANNGVNNAFDDGSASNHTISESGNVPVQGSFGPFARPDGEWGITYDNGYLSFPDSADWTLGTTFTLEAFINPSRLLAYNSIMHHAGWYFTVLANGALQVNGMGGNGDSTAGVVALNTWSHVAFSVSSGTGTFYVNGVAKGTTSSNNIGDGSGAFYVGKQGTSYWPFYGTQSNYRVVKGTAVYTSNFTPPTAPLTAITNTVLLTGQSNRFVDNSTSAHTVTPSGNPSVSAFGAILTDAAYDPAVNGASAFFTGAADDALTGPTSNDFGFGDNSFTVEVWIYPTVIDNYKVPIGTSGASGNGRWYISYGSPKIYWGSYGNGSDGDFTVDHDMTPNAWYHLAYVRNKSDDKGRLYVNGVQKGVQDDARTYANPSQVLKIGKDHTANNNMKGYISDARVVNGTAVYTSAFTPPAAPLTAITNTKLLLNMANGQAIDSAAQNNLTLIGGTKISTGQAKFGDTSIYFDGAGDYATLTNSASNNLGDGDWTIEGWLYLTANAGTGNDEFAVASKFGGGSTRSWLARIANGNKLTFWYINSSGTQVELTADTRVLSLNTWYHVAWVKNSNLKVYINGVGATLASSDFQIRDGTDLIQLSGRASGDNMYEGYIDDFRISSMARYTNNFTAPTKPFADKGQ